MTLTKVRITEDLSKALKLTTDKQKAEALVEIFFEEIRFLLEQGHQLRLSGFGNFNLRDKKERPGRNPKTGKVVPITPRRVVTFRTGLKLKARVEKYEGHKTSKEMSARTKKR
ncbi:MAG: integration host factor subunit alpha [uncultured bacterium]|nr:MAG: integration host factor subunit alpha [uncultured bacterium]